jgi:3-hydroxyisobutyrate dehydrogenase-like beta-hydroxyacid dehydrogenase
MKVAVLGLGEAGSLIAADLAGGGDEVHAYDPAVAQAPEGVTLHPEAATTVVGCELVMALTAGSVAKEALTGVIDSLGDHPVYSDLSTAAPSLKMDLAGMLAARGVLFADVALMAPVPGRGLAAPSLASGSGAVRYAEMINDRGGRVEVVGADPGEAATRKLLRSIVMKGVAAVLIESMDAAGEAGKTEWFWGHIVEALAGLDEPMLRRLVFDTAPHARRRIDEMEAARDLLDELGLPSTMTAATITHLRRLAGEGTA